MPCEGDVCREQYLKKLYSISQYALTCLAISARETSRTHTLEVDGEVDAGPSILTRHSCGALIGNCGRQNVLPVVLSHYDTLKTARRFETMFYYFISTESIKHCR